MFFHMIFFVWDKITEKITLKNPITPRFFETKSPIPGVFKNQIPRPGGMGSPWGPYHPKA